MANVALIFFNSKLSENNFCPSPILLNVKLKLDLAMVSEIANAISLKFLSKTSEMFSIGGSERIFSKFNNANDIDDKFCCFFNIFDGYETIEVLLLS